MNQLSLADNASVILNTLNKGENQKFKFTRVDTNTFVLSPNHVNNKMLAFDGNNLVQKPYNTSSSTNAGKFVFTRTDNNTYYITDMQTGQKLASSGNSIILVSASTTGTSVQWILNLCGSHIDTDYTYNSDGTLLTSVSDTRGNTTSYAYDS